MKMQIPYIKTDRLYFSFEDFTTLNNLSQELIEYLKLDELNYEAEKIQAVLDYSYGRNVYVVDVDYDGWISAVLTGHTDPSKRLDDLKDVFHTQFKYTLQKLGGKYSLTEDDEADVYHQISDDEITATFRLIRIEMLFDKVLFCYIVEDDYYDEEGWLNSKGEYVMNAKYASVDRLNRIWLMLKDK